LFGGKTIPRYSSLRDVQTRRNCSLHAVLGALTLPS